MTCARSISCLNCGSKPKSLLVVICAPISTALLVANAVLLPLSVKDFEYSKSDRQIRVFISSTFRDMQAKRDYPVNFTFPQLHKLSLEKLGIAAYKKVIDSPLNSAKMLIAVDTLIAPLLLPYTLPCTPE